MEPLGVNPWMRPYEAMDEAGNEAPDDTHIYEHLMEAAYAVTSDDALGWFQHRGYL
jgi:hypothetical protein